MSLCLVVSNGGKLETSVHRLAGPTSCVKSQLTFKFISNVTSMMTPAPSRFMYCYGEYQNLFSHYPHVEFNQGLPDVTAFDG